ncbi:hypothetical protein SAMN04489841_2819 [Natrinema salaciae]|uniref:Uncharacterized protein n=1 Tax=Natrinema salaciae TaxID=1186196 RepID=A0A1H9K733_9EURY|nr:hypothetical protein SAMN04489841_2819 [Natrinema salaciae]
MVPEGTVRPRRTPGSEPVPVHPVAIVSNSLFAQLRTIGPRPTKRADESDSIGQESADDKHRPLEIVDENDDASARVFLVSRW